MVVSVIAREDVCRVVIIHMMQETRRERAYLRAANEWLRWEDEEGETIDGEDIFAIRDLHARAEGWLAEAEHEAYMRGDRWEGGMGPYTHRAQWVRALREEAGRMEVESEQALDLYDVEDLWDFHILFGDAPLQPDHSADNCDLEEWE
ncbi:uncharacterized protein LOC107041303 [Diachasma alloeum]|uniref:uncharacterized protein LOC107041303 n=1 Tax=Diachasma alloeum TaxID=454923 RepID=UPI00073821A8|nr:uncharacterized protein LOC107041303 [Diachasma alloeum]